MTREEAVEFRDKWPDGSDVHRLACAVIAMHDILRANGDTPWPLSWVLTRLADAGDHLLDVHDCDDNGHEEIRFAVASAREIAGNIRARIGT